MATIAVTMYRPAHSALLPALVSGAAEAGIALVASRTVGGTSDFAPATLPVTAPRRLSAMGLVGLGAMTSAATPHARRLRPATNALLQ